MCRTLITLCVNAPACHYVYVMQPLSVPRDMVVVAASAACEQWLKVTKRQANIQIVELELAGDATDQIPIIFSFTMKFHREFHYWK